MNTLMGIPVSTTHTITGAIVGVGATRRLSAVRWGVARRVVWAWVLTIPISGITAAAGILIVRLFRRLRPGRRPGRAAGAAPAYSAASAALHLGEVLLVVEAALDEPVGQPPVAALAGDELVGQGGEHGPGLGPVAPQFLEQAARGGEDGEQPGVGDVRVARRSRRSTAPGRRPARSMKWWVARSEEIRWQSTSSALHSLSAGRRRARASSAPSKAAASRPRKSSPAAATAADRAAAVAGGSSRGRAESVIVVLAFSAPR